MKTNISILAILAFFLMSFQTQNEPSRSAQGDMTGKVYKIQVQDAPSFDYINLPKANFVRKMGGILSIKDLHEMEVRVKEHDSEKGTSKLERVDGKKFFNAVPVLHAELDQAESAGELVAQ